MSEILKAYLENEPAIRRFLIRSGARDHEVDDFAQETFLRGFAAEMRADIDEPKAYLFRIARNIAHEKFRKSVRTPVSMAEDSVSADLLIDEDQAAADEWLDGRRKLALFAEAVAHLPLQCRKAFLLRRIEGLQYKQIANRMNITVSAVEKHVTTGVLKCKAYLKSRGYQPSEFGMKPKAKANGNPKAFEAANDGAVKQDE